jgi:polar amino acid transport system substrate-binding protein
VSSVIADVVHDLAPTGRLRATINLGNTVLAQQDLGTGALGEVSVELARELARRLGVEATLHPFGTAGKAFAALQSGACDIGFLAIDPKGALVPASSPLLDVDDVDRRRSRGGKPARAEDAGLHRRRDRDWCAPGEQAIRKSTLYDAGRGGRGTKVVC